MMKASMANEGIVRIRNRTSALAHKPSLLRTITGKPAQENIDQYYLYATAANVDKCPVVFSSANHDRAVLVLKS
jgi:hypothetical protein